MPRSFSSAAIARTVVIPWDRRSSTIERNVAAVLRIRLDGGYGLVLPIYLPLSARAPLGLPSFTPRALAAARAALVRSLINPASNPATEAIWVRRKRPMAPAGTVGKSTEQQVDAARYERPQQVYVSRQAVQLGEYHGGTNRFRVRKSLGQLGSVGALAAFGLDVLGHRLPPATIQA